MEKYSGLKTIGDGTYGSVVKAMNVKTSKVGFGSDGQARLWRLRK